MSTRQKINLSCILLVCFFVFTLSIFGLEVVFVDSGQSLGHPLGGEIAIGDLDGDGDLDVFLAVGTSASRVPNQVWINSGNGYLLDSGQRLGNSNSTDVVMGDLDGDGDIDAFVTNCYNQPNKVWLNNGNGTFTQGQSVGNSTSKRLAVGDLDGDGDLDVYVTNEYNPDKVWVNNGLGTFTLGQNVGNSNGSSVALGDLDGDGDLDVFVANCNQTGPQPPDKVWLNNGNGTFTDSGQNLGNSASFAIELGDLDGDGDLDAIIALPLANKIWINNGNGIFSDSGQMLGASRSYGVAIGDLDSDNDLDLFFSNVYKAADKYQPNEIWLNDGNGIFFDSGQRLGNSYSCSTALGDLDGDNDLDAYVANLNGADRIWLNLTINNVNQPPVAECKNIGLSVDENCQAFLTPVDVDNGSYDPDEGDEITLSIDNEGPLSTGVHYVTLTVADDNGESDTCMATVTIKDTTNPVINSLTASPDVLWPPNHKMVQVIINAVVSDNCDANPVTKIVSVTSNEPVNGTVDGDIAPDWEIKGDMTLNLRVERSGTGSGRIYTITVKSTDAGGNSSTQDVTVTVPKNKKKK